MTTTKLFSGYDGEGKSSSRVLNPPGGRSSNIFGGDEPPQPKVKFEQPPQQSTDQNQNSGATNPPAQQNYQQPDMKKKDGGEAPYATFEESGKPSIPTQFDRCDAGSQNEADFRCYSVTAYREAVKQNADVRQRARGQVSSGFNPITHEESNGSPFQDYENGRNHQQKRTGKMQQQNKGKVSYNPITGEEIPEDYGKKNKKESKEEEEENTDKKEEETSEENSSTNAAKPTVAPEPQPVSAHKPTVKVRQPPGGASSGLW